MRALRFAAAAWLVLAAVLLRPTFTRDELASLYEQLPELTLAALAAGGLPVVVALLSALRWARGRREDATPLAAATRWAVILSLLSLLLPLHARDVAAAGSELAYRSGQLVALLFLLDGPLAPAEPRDRSLPDPERRR
jgi:hypothetical protein